MEGMSSPSDYFRKKSPPQCLNGVVEKLEKFIKQQSLVYGKCIVVVTSGGTSVPLETNTIRFIDNFSTGARGAASVESFLGLGYAVIYMYRPGSIAPFARHLQNCTSKHIDLDLLSYLELTDKKSLTFRFRQGQNDWKVVDAMEKYRTVQASGSLLALPFNTVDDYLFLLRDVAKELNPLGSKVLFYLAAAVSDYHIQEDKMALHKIQSSSGEIDLHLHPVPKLLGELRYEWCPRACYVSFKLETDLTILQQKAQASITNYGMHMVVANELKTRSHRVYLITKDDEVIIDKDEDSSDIENQIAGSVALMHFEFIGSQTVNIANYGTKKHRSFLDRFSRMFKSNEEQNMEILSVAVTTVLLIVIPVLQLKIMKMLQ